MSDGGTIYMLKKQTRGAVDHLTIGALVCHCTIPALDWSLHDLLRVSTHTQNILTG